MTFIVIILVILIIIVLSKNAERREEERKSEQEKQERKEIEKRIASFRTKLYEYAKQQKKIGSIIGGRDHNKDNPKDLARFNEMFNGFVKQYKLDAKFRFGRFEDEAQMMLQIAILKQGEDINEGIKHVVRKSKFQMSQSEFEICINEQLNEQRANYTKILWVGDSHRTHPWSMRPGGCTVVVIFNNGKCYGYDKVKRPDRYTEKISEDYIVNNYSNYRHNSIESYLNEIYLTEDSGVKLNKVWHNRMGVSPWLLLEKYRTA